MGAAGVNLVVINKNITGKFSAPFLQLWIIEIT